MIENIWRCYNMKTYKKALAFGLTVLMTTATAMPASAAETSSHKEEVVYIMTQSNGTVDDIDVVNIFSGGDITDYGDYTSVKVLNTTDEIHQTKDKITLTSSAEKVYYQGTLQGKEIPWNISLRYFLDGREYTEKEIAGKSGSLEIRVSITQNNRCTGSYFDDYALQATFLLDTNLCSSIRADGATIANVGSDKQLTYTILPGKGLKTSIYADTENFEMDPVSINGIKLNLNVEIDEEELTEKVAALIEATEKLNEGATTLQHGTEGLKMGSNSLNTGILSLKTGAGELDSGIAALQRGMKSMQTGLETLDQQSSALKTGSAQIKSALKTVQKNLDTISVSTEQLQKLTSSSGQIKNGISDLSDGIASLKNNLGYTQYQAILAQNGLNIDSLKNNNQQAIADCSDQIASLNQTIAVLESQTGTENQVAQLKEQIANLENISTLLSANNAAIDGTENYLNNVSSGVDDLDAGASALKQQYDTFDTAIWELTDTLGNLTTGMSQLTTAINQLVASYETLDEGLTGYTDGVATIVSGHHQMIDGISSLALGSKELLEGSGRLSSGSSDLYDGVLSLCSGAKELNTGTGKLYAETSTMDTQIQQQIQQILSSIEGEKTDAESFVSEKNENVDSVQFVMKTDAIAKEETEKEKTEKTESESLWQKLIGLFGF